MSDIKFTIDDKECTAKSGQTITQAAKENGIYIPTLCDFDGLKPAGTCRICTVSINGRNMAGCTTPVEEGMKVENNTPVIEGLRKALVEILFVEGNHFCPSCEKSGNCDLQALAYRYQMMVPRFPYSFPIKEIEASAPNLMIDANRCIRCLRCVRGVRTSDGKAVFGLVDRGDQANIGIDKAAAATLSEDDAMKAMELCPVGAIIKKKVGFAVPIGNRKFDKNPIGSEIEG
ncbi:MAG: 2Fe-2S iron-sulfur cluster-binding protein [Bacteroidales bacterium]|jgi:[NiFe] hydrogenase diaphorase moiety small subunit|nr:2Fe-2S iron-sulfur cluster-binding protein [Bacteroidales bacterium]